MSLAEKAVGLSSSCPHWNTLGVARYRAGDFAGAIKALQKCDELIPSGHAALNDFFLAMAHWQQGNQDKARELYQRAVDGWDHLDRVVMKSCFASEQKPST